jgi:cob(I)alamin adenosyltransferase
MTSNPNKGLVMVFTGPGKGKTTAALGAAVRAAGSGLKVRIFQFIKNRDTGELSALAHVPNLTIEQWGGGMIGRAGPTEEDRDRAREALAEARSAAESGTYGLIVLDEIGPSLKYGLISEADVLTFIADRPPEVHVILTGRDMPEAVTNAADTVTRMERVRHHYQAGIKAQKGIEY